MSVSTKALAVLGTGISVLCGVVSADPPVQCFILTATPKACSGCADVNHCGKCSVDLGTPQCDAILAAFCVAGTDLTPVACGGVTLTYVTVPCQRYYPCVTPTPCPNVSCTVSPIAIGASEASTTILAEELGCDDCP